MDVKEYEKLIRMQKSGRFVIKFNHEKQEKKSFKPLAKGENETLTESQIDSVLWSQSLNYMKEHLIKYTFTLNLTSFIAFS